MTTGTVDLDGVGLTRGAVLAIACERARVVVAQKARAAAARASAFIDDQVRAGARIYGVTTGFGRNADRPINPEDAALLQRNLILSHTAGNGPPLGKELVRALMAVRINTLLRGHSGIRLETLDLLVSMLNKGVHPRIPARGSVGASGDLAPLSHMAAVLLGEGEAEFQGEVLPGGEALARAGLGPVVLSYKEGLALNNGTTLMTVFLLFALDRMERLLKLADIGAALGLEALAGRSAALDERVHALRPHPGQIKVAGNLRRLLAGSTLLDIPCQEVPCADGSFRDRRGGKPDKPQDAYSFRCAPQVQGAVRDTVAHARGVLECELNAVTDNPILFPGEEQAVISAGNFHGMPLALALACLKVSLPPLAGIAERRLAALVDEHQSDGLPRFLVSDGEGMDSGVMLLQYSAAALVNELATKAHPASVYSLPTCANTEDFVSMGANEGLAVLEMTELLQEVLVLEFFVASQALELRCRLLAAAGQRGGGGCLVRGPGRATARVLKRIRKALPFIERDAQGVMQESLQRLRPLLAGQELIAAAQAETGPL